MNKPSNPMISVKAGFKPEIKLEFAHDSLIGVSDEFRSVLFNIEQAAPTDTTVLISGEPGTGKELVARELHRLSSRKNGPLLKANCAAPPSALLECDLFSHERDSIPGAPNWRRMLSELTGDATIFLDEIGELPLKFQVKLVGILRENERKRPGRNTPQNRDIRIIAATRHHLPALVREHRFHEELWHHINAFSITIPPLRNRLKDLGPLADFFVGKFSGQLGKRIEIIPMSVMTGLRAHHWPGNVRELEKVLKDAVIHSTGPCLELSANFNEIRREQSYLASRIGNEGEIPSPMVSVSSVPAHT